MSNHLTVAGYGADALAPPQCPRRRRRPFAAILLDLNLPDMGGLDILTAVVFGFPGFDGHLIGAGSNASGWVSIPGVSVREQG